MANDVPKDECCGSLGIGYDDEVSSESIFMLAAGIQKQACKPCRGWCDDHSCVRAGLITALHASPNPKIETCENSNCGEGKRCIMKKGLPKCVCAPNCKATAAANKQNRKVGSAKKIAVIQMPEMRNLRRNEKRLTPSEMQNDEPTLIVANFNRRQGIKKPTQGGKKNANEALVYSPLIRANLEQPDQVLQVTSSGNASKNNTTDDSKTIEMKIRNGFFNDNTLKVTSYVVDEYYGNLVSKEVVFKQLHRLDNLIYKNKKMIIGKIFIGERH